jgi:hypothetical protein
VVEIVILWWGDGMLSRVIDNQRQDAWDVEATLRQNTLPTSVIVVKGRFMSINFQDEVSPEVYA